jgi:hypothetical protein
MRIRSLIALVAAGALLGGVPATAASQSSHQSSTRHSKKHHKRKHHKKHTTSPAPKPYGY